MAVVLLRGHTPLPIRKQSSDAQTRREQGKRSGICACRGWSHCDAEG